MLPAMEWIGDLERAFAAGIYPNRGPIAIGIAVGFVVLSIIAKRRGWFDGIRRHPVRSAAVAVLAVVIASPIAWYLASPLILSTTIDEPPPVVAAEPTPSPSPGPTPPAAAPSTPRSTSAPSPSASPTPAPVMLTGTFTGADDFHFGRGTARLIETAPGTFVVRLEDFAVRNGPDLYVYLSPDAAGYTDGVLELGKLKADKGNQNYDVPTGLNSATAASVVIWCKQFSVLFAVAPLVAEG